MNKKKELDAKYSIFGKFGSKLKLAVAEKLPILMSILISNY